MKNILLKLTILIAFVLNVVLVKAQPSSFSLLSPINGNYVNTLPYFDWANSSNATSYQLYVDGALKKANILNSNYQLQIGEELTAGMHTWYIIAVGAGTTQSNEVWSFRVDAAQPAVFNLITPTDNFWTTSLQPRFSWSASNDANSGLLKYQLWVDGSLNKDNISVDSTSTTPNGYLTNGEHTWLIKAVDNVDNVKNSSQEWTIYVDNVPPNIDTYDDKVLELHHWHSDYAISAKTNVLNIKSNKLITIEALINKAENFQKNNWISQNYGTIVDKQNNYSLYVEPYPTSSLYSNKFRLKCKIGNQEVISNSLINTSEWHHVAATFDGNYIRLYIDGKYDNKSNLVTFTTTTNDEPFRIGSRIINLLNHSVVGYFSGMIDELRIWDKTLSELELLQNKDLIREPNEQPNLIGYWRFNESAGNTIFDKTLNATDLTSSSYSSIIKSNRGFTNTCKMHHPYQNEYINSTLPTFIWGKTKDSGIGVQKFQLFINGELAKDNLTDSLYTMQTFLSYGKQNWFVKAFDSLGNNQSSYSRDFYVDNAAPNPFDLKSPETNEIVNLPTPNFSWQATIDSINGCGLSKYQLWINGTINRDSIPIHQTTVAPSNVLAQGKYTWFIRAYDKLGNMRQSTQDFTFFVDWETPTVFNLIEPNNNEVITSSKPTFKWNASSDIGSGLNKYELHISGENVITLLPADTTIKLPFDLSNGAYTWFVKAYDVAGGFTSSNTQSFTVDIPLPDKAGIPKGEENLCVNSENTDYVTDGADNATSYIWEISPSEAGIITGNGLTGTVDWNDTFTGIAEVKVNGQNNGGVGVFSSPIIITIYPTTVAGSVEGSANICKGQSTGTLVLTGNTGNIIKWQKKLNGGDWSDIANTVNTYSETPSIVGIWEYRAEVQSGVCSSEFSTAATINVGNIPASAGTISGATTVCQGESSVTYTVPAIANATSYVWTLPNDATGTSTTRSITVNYGTSATSGNITVKGKNTCGEGAVSTLAITVNALPTAAGTISGATTVCQGESSVTYTVPAIANATSYVWTLPNDATGTSTTRSITVNYGTSATSGNITVKGKNTCGEGAVSTLAITVNALPSAAGTISGATTVCQGVSSVTYTVPAIANATSYVWTLPNGATGTSTTRSITVDYGLSATSGIVSVKGTNACGDGEIFTLFITVNEIPSTPSISKNDDVLSSNTSEGNQWYNQYGLISDELSQNYTVTEDGSYYVIVTLEGCSSEPSNIIEIISTSIELFEDEKAFKVYPNPVTNDLTIEIKGNYVRLNYELINANGQILMNGSLVDKTTIKTSSLVPGVYLIKLENGKSFEFKKIIKE